MGWAPLPSDAQLDDANNGSVIRQPSQLEQSPTNATPSAGAPAGFVPLPSDAQLDHESAQPHTPSPDEVQAANEELRRMYHAGSSTADIVKRGRALGIDPNPDQIDKARANGADIMFVNHRQEEPSAGQQLIDNTKNDLAGIAQGAAALPDAAAMGVGKVLSVIPNAISHALSAAGHDDAAKWIQDNITHNLANPPQIGDAIEKVAPTPDTTTGKVNRFVGNMVGGAVTVPASAVESTVARIVGDAPKAVVPVAKAAETAATETPAAVDAARAANDLGVTLPKFALNDADRASAGALEQTTFGRGPIRAGRAAMLDTSEAARNTIANNLGTAAETPAQLGDETLDAAVKANKARRANIGTLYNYAQSASLGTRVNPDQTINTIDSLLTDENSKIGGSKIAPILQNIKDDLSQAGSITVDQARDLRTTLREQLTNEAGSTPSNADRITNQVMAAVNADMKSSLPADAFGIYKQADTAWAQQRTLEDDVLKPFLGKDFDNWGEQVAAKINSDAKGNGTRLARFLGSLPEDQANNVRASLVMGLGKAKDGAQSAAGDNFSLSTFLTNWNQLSGAKRLVFAPETVQALDKLAKVADVAKLAESERNFSKTGGVVSRLLMGGGEIGSGAALFTGHVHEGVIGILATGLMGLRQYSAAKLLASPEFAKRLASTPMNAKGAAAYWSRPWVTAMANKNPVIAGEILAFQRSVLANDNGVVPAASANADQQNQNQ